MIYDPHFRVVIDPNGTSPNPYVSIWSAQHGTVIEGFSYDDPAPTSEKAIDIIIRHQLAGNRGHYSVLQHASITFGVAGFPHSAIAQITRHQDSHFLVQSARYTGDRFIKVATGELTPEEVFYWRPTGKHKSRDGFYERTEEMNQARRNHIIGSCELYKAEIDVGVPYEDARGGISYDFRQNLTISGTWQAFFHWLDQRSKADSQLEIQVLAEMCFAKFSELYPEIAGWYSSNRWGRAILAP